MASTYGPAILLLGLGLLFSLFYLQSVFKWWYEDDPGQFHYVLEIDDPVAFFLDPDVMRGFGTGTALVPMQLLSYWVDARLFGPGPTPAYVHSVVSLLLTLWMLHFMLLGWTRNRAAAMGGAVLWLGLPSTLAVHHFLATRHYMEGLFFGLLAAYCVRRLCDQSRRPGRDASLIVAAAICGGTAMLFKEIYAAMVPAYFFMTGSVRSTTSTNSRGPMRMPGG